MFIESDRLVDFLQEELGIPTTAIAIAERAYKSVTSRYQERNPSLLAVILWQYGLVTLEQLDRILDWLDAQSLITPTI